MYMVWDRQAVAEEATAKAQQKGLSQSGGGDADGEQRNMLFKGEEDEESRGLMTSNGTISNVLHSVEIANQGLTKKLSVSEAKKKKDPGMSANDLRSENGSSAPEHSDEDASSSKSGKLD